MNFVNAPQRNKSALVEDHIISREMLSGKNKALFLNEAGTAAVMVGEEDHIRIQAIAAGFDLENVFAAADAIDDAMGKVLNFAFDERFGFLTHCPTNVGTGMRASVMLHLPALRMAGNINSLIGQVGKLGLTIRGVYGEGSESRGDLYQLSNQITLGLSEQQTIEKLSDIVKQIIKMERDARKR
ncbi:MAG: ATP--guanido phosphotransferase, partial [Peptococcaceae bacterium]|nr:ATP--guanido phosphotransferase [Peptococcaceae bacterium]